MPDLQKRFEHERRQAASRTLRLRELRIKGELPFNTPPKSRRNRDYWEYRRGKILDPAIRSWELAASYGPLEANDLADMIWLLSNSAPASGTDLAGGASDVTERSRNARRSRGLVLGVTTGAIFAAPDGVVRDELP